MNEAIWQIWSSLAFLVGPVVYSRNLCVFKCPHFLPLRGAIDQNGVLAGGGSSSIYFFKFENEHREKKNRIYLLLLLLFSLPSVLLFLLLLCYLTGQKWCIYYLFNVIQWFVIFFPIYINGTDKLVARRFLFENVWFIFFICIFDFIPIESRFTHTHTSNLNAVP